MYRFEWSVIPGPVKMYLCHSGVNYSSRLRTFGTEEIRPSTYYFVENKSSYDIVSTYNFLYCNKLLDDMYQNECQSQRFWMATLIHSWITWTVPFLILFSLLLFFIFYFFPLFYFLERRSLTDIRFTEVVELEGRDRWRFLVKLSVHFLRLCSLVCQCIRPSS